MSERSPRAPGPGAAVALVGGLALGLATPPAPLPFVEWLVLPALMMWFAIATASARPLRHAYLFGCVHMAWFSWSVHHVLLPAYLAIVFVGGLYYLLAAWVTRALPARLAIVGFAVAVAASFWLRASMPEIHYPHGQACHCLWQWPDLLGSVVLGGEPLANLLLAAAAASAVVVWRSWRVAAPSWRTAWRTAVGVALVAAALTITGSLVNRRANPPQTTATVTVVAIEPGFHPFEIRQLPPEAQRERYLTLVRERLIEPTRLELLREPFADLILWPESSVVDEPSAARIADGAVTVLPQVFPPSATRLVVGASVRNEQGSAPSALLVELPGGRVLAHHDKQYLVPGGEFVPLLGLLPAALADLLRDLFVQALGSAPDCVPGVPRPPMETAAGVPFGAMLCYDNAFPGPARELVAAGARFLVVLSNEAWYRGGAELQQLVAMTVVRALENATPIVRCTQDGWSVAIGADGRLVAALEVAAAPQPAARKLRVSLTPGLGQEPPMAWLRRGFGPFCGLLLGLAVAHGLWRWVRLRSARSAAPAAPGTGPSGSGARGA